MRAQSAPRSIAGKVEVTEDMHFVAARDEHGKVVIDTIAIGTIVPLVEFSSAERASFKEQMDIDRRRVVFILWKDKVRRVFDTSVRKAR